MLLFVWKAWVHGRDAVACEEREHGVERGPGPVHVSVGRRKRRLADHRAQKAFGRGGRVLDVDILSSSPADPVAQLLEQYGTAAAASSEQDRNS